MPVIIAIAIRYVIMAAVQLGLWSLIEKYGLPLLDTAIVKTAEMFGVSEEDAQAFVANSLLKAFEEVGIFAITLKTKLPIIVAERLGFTSKGFNIRKLSAAGEAKLPKVATVAAAETVATAEEVTKVAEVIAKSRMTSFAVVSSVYKAIMAFVGVTALVAMTVGNFIDFGNWQGAYQKTFQKLFTALGFPPDSPMPKSKAVSATTWTKIYTVVEELNPVTIAFPWDDNIKPYSRNNLADAVDHFSANLAVHGVNPTWKSVWGLLLPTLGLKTPAGATIITPQVASATVTTPQLPQVHVFSGVVSSGVVGSTAAFTPRPDDLIENAAELTTASHNNLAPFIAAIGSRMSYTIKIVPSVKSASGFTQRGTVQKIISGYNKNGTPKYRQVVNKFAVMDIYVRTDKTSQAHITTIVLGPVDSVKFQAANVDMTAVASSVQQNIIAPAVVAATTPAPAPATYVPPTPTVNTPSPGVIGKTAYYSTNTNNILQYTAMMFAGNVPYGYTPITKDAYIAGLRERITFAQSHLPGMLPPGYVGATFTQGDIGPLQTLIDSAVNSTGINAPNYSWPGYYAGPITPENVVGLYSTPQGVATTTAPAFTTLFDYYQAHGQTLPSVEERSKLYEQLALGQAAYYTGTAEQNTKLLAALQGARL